MCSGGRGVMLTAQKNLKKVLKLSRSRPIQELSEVLYKVR